MKKLKIGVVGAGHLGTVHVKLLKTIGNCELIGLFDLDGEKAEKVSSEYNIRNFASLSEMFGSCDAVSVVTSTSSHHKIAKEALENNKHVFIEKPITTHIAEAEELVKIADERKLKIQVGHIERFNPALASLEKYNIEPMFIQTDRLAQFNPRGTDVAVVLDLMIHDIDIILSLVKSEVKEIKANGVSVVSDNIDIANARIEFENGAVANVTASRISQKKMRKMRMFQRDVYLSLDFTEGVSEVFRLVPPAEMEKEHFLSFGEMGIGDKKKMVVYEQPKVVEINALQHELKLFIDAVLEDKRPVVNGEDGLKALKVAAMIITEIEKTRLQ